MPPAHEFVARRTPLDGWEHGAPGAKAREAFADLLESFVHPGLMHGFLYTLVAERERAVAESENEFLREFEALLRGGLDVDVRPSDEWRRANGSRATVEHALLSLGTDTRGRARCAWTVGERDTAFLVAEMRCVARCVEINQWVRLS